MLEGAIYMEKYCSRCDKETFVTVKTVHEVYNVKGKDIEIDADVCVCKECGEQLWDDKIDGNNLRKAYAEYRRLNNLLQPEEIKQIRDKYHLSQSTFSKILGLGEKTITRYENGSIQEKSQDNLMKLVNDINNFKRLYNLSLTELSESEKMKIDNTLHEFENKNVISFESARFQLYSSNKDMYQYELQMEM